MQKNSTKKILLDSVKRILRETGAFEEAAKLAWFDTFKKRYALSTYIQTLDAMKLWAISKNVTAEVLPKLMRELSEAQRQLSLEQLEKAELPLVITYDELRDVVFIDEKHFIDDISLLKWFQTTQTSSSWRQPNCADILKAQLTVYLFMLTHGRKSDIVSIPIITTFDPYNKYTKERTKGDGTKLAERMLAEEKCNGYILKYSRRDMRYVGKRVKTGHIYGSFDEPLDKFGCDIIRMYLQYVPRDDTGIRTVLNLSELEYAMIDNITPKNIKPVQNLTNNKKVTFNELRRAEFMSFMTSDIAIMLTELNQKVELAGHDLITAWKYYLRAASALTGSDSAPEVVE